MSDIMKMGKNPNYLGSWDLDELPNREVTLTIEKIVDEKVIANGGTSEVCTVCYWKEDAFKPMILNVTNKKRICALYKTKETEKLVGKAVVIGVERVKAFGDVWDALRIRKRIPQVAEPVKCSDCGNAIQGAFGKGADYIAMHTKKNYGVCLCSDCAAKRKAQQEAEGVKDDANETDG